MTATAKYGGHQAASNPAPIQVFPPLLLDPRNITLIIGAKFQVRTMGGPQPDSAIEFMLHNVRVAKSNNVGLIDALTLGSTKLTARAVGIDKLTGRKHFIHFTASVVVDFHFESVLERPVDDQCVIALVNVPLPGLDPMFSYSED